MDTLYSKLFFVSLFSIMAAFTSCAAKPTVVIEQIGFGFPGGASQVPEGSSFYAAAVIKVSQNGGNPVSVESANPSAVHLVYDWKIQDPNVAVVVGDANQSSIMIQASRLGLWNGDYGAINGRTYSNCGITLSVKDKDDGTVYARSTAVFRINYK